MEAYVERVCAEVRGVRAWAAELGAEMPGVVDTVYFGGGTPSLLPPRLIGRMFAGLRENFELERGAEMTVECAPGQLAEETLEAFQREGVDRLSFGVQSFVDAECAAVGRLHTGVECRAELARVAAAGVRRVGVDLIAGLPHQTEASWRYTVDEAIASGVEHVSVYMLEVDEDSRLGRESIAGGVRYGAGALPNEDRVADWYAAACEWLEAAGVRQYEISNFARAGGEARHNRKYWTREPYIGVGMDAHSMLRVGEGGVRWANADTMEGYLNGAARTVDRVGALEAFEEEMFLRLRLNEGVDVTGREGVLVEVESAGLVVRDGARVRLTARGRMASNEVFGRLLDTGTREQAMEALGS